jgi:hypothetical protein
MMWGSIHPVVPGLFPFEGGLGCWIFSVPNLFPWNFHSVFINLARSQYIPQLFNVFPNLFPIALSLCHILGLQFYSYNLYKGAQRMRLQHIISVWGMFKSWKLCQAKQRCWSVFVFFLGEILPNFNLKNMISTYSKDSPWKKWPKFARFPIEKFQIIRFLW